MLLKECGFYLIFLLKNQSTWTDKNHVNLGKEKLQADLAVASQYLKGAKRRERNSGQRHVVIGHREMAKT